MARTSVADCEKLLVDIGKRGKFRVWKRGDPEPKTGGYFFIGIAYGKPRVHYQYRVGGISDISPRLSTGRLCEWMRVYGVAGFREWLQYRMRD